MVTITEIQRLTDDLEAILLAQPSDHETYILRTRIQELKKKTDLSAEENHAIAYKAYKKETDFQVQDMVELNDRLIDMINRLWEVAEEKITQALSYRFSLFQLQRLERGFGVPILDDLEPSVIGKPAALTLELLQDMLTRYADNYHKGYRLEFRDLYQPIKPPASTDIPF